MTRQITTEPFPVMNRWNGVVLFTAEIPVTPDMAPSRKLGLAAEWAMENNVSLSDADLHAADMRGANMRGADISGTDMSDASLFFADMRDADMRGANMRRCLT